jgi:hypothetical protein
VVCVIVTNFLLVLPDEPDKLPSIELARDSSELDCGTETSLLPDTAIVGAADSPELTDDS